MERKISVKKISTKILCGFLCILLIFTAVMADCREAKAVAIVDDLAFWTFILAMGGVAILQSNVVEGWFDNDVKDDLTNAIDGNLALQLFPDPDDDKDEEPEKDEYDRIEKDGKEEWTTVEGMKKYIDTTGQSITLTAITTLAIVQGVAEYFSKNKKTANVVVEDDLHVFYDVMPNLSYYSKWSSYESHKESFDSLYNDYVNFANSLDSYVAKVWRGEELAPTEVELSYINPDNDSWGDSNYIIATSDGTLGTTKKLGADLEHTEIVGRNSNTFMNYEGKWSSYYTKQYYGSGVSDFGTDSFSIYLHGDNAFFWDGENWISSKSKARVIEGDPIQGPQLAPETTTQPTFNPSKEADYTEKLKELDDKINEIKQNTDPAKQNEAIQDAVNAYLKDIQDDAKKETDKIVNPDPDPTPNPDPDPDPDPEPGTTETPDKDDAPDQGKEPELPELTWHDLALDLENVFPFCIPWDFYKLLCALFVPAKAFEIHESIDIGSVHLGRYDIDCNDYNDFVRIVRLFQEILYVGILMKASRRIKGGR